MIIHYRFYQILKVNVLPCSSASYFLLVRISEHWDVILSRKNFQICLDTFFIMLFLRWFKLVYICVNALAHVGQRFSWHTNSLVNVISKCVCVCVYIIIYIYNINWFFITRSEGRDYTLWINEYKISCHSITKLPAQTLKFSLKQLETGQPSEITVARYFQ